MATDNFRRAFLPYTVWTDGKGTWRVMNREYCDLGTMGVSGGFGPVTDHRLKGGGRAMLERASWNGEVRTFADSEEMQVWLYNDGCLPDRSAAAWSAYCKRLRVLCCLVQRDERRANADRATV